MTKVTITYEQLESKDACSQQLYRFKKTFPKGISVTSEEELVAIAKNFGKDFDIDWAARNLLSEDHFAKGRTITQPAYDEYNQVRQTAWENYLDKHEESEQKVAEEYKEVEQPPLLDYLCRWEEFQQEAYENHKRDIYPVWVELKESVAIVFAKLYYEQESTWVPCRRNRG